MTCFSLLSSRKKNFISLVHSVFVKKNSATPRLSVLKRKRKRMNLMLLNLRLRPVFFDHR